MGMSDQPANDKNTVSIFGDKRLDLSTPEGVIAGCEITVDAAARGVINPSDVGAIVKVFQVALEAQQRRTPARATQPATPKPATRPAEGPFRPQLVQDSERRVK